MVNQVVHANGQTDTYALDPNSMRRPAVITATNAAGAVRWATGSYAFDGATVFPTSWFRMGMMESPMFLGWMTNSHSPSLGFKETVGRTSSSGMGGLWPTRVSSSRTKTPFQRRRLRSVAASATAPATASAQPGRPAGV
jgi:hypothetical protein